MVGGEIREHVREGSGNSKASMLCEYWDPDRRTWVQMPAFASQRQCFGIACNRTTLYSLGGWNRRHTAVVANFERFDSDSWSIELMAPMPTARCKLLAVYMPGYVYAVGGFDRMDWIPQMNALGALERYSFEASRWETLPPMPTPRGSMAGGVVNGKVLVAGGFNGTSDLSVLESFDPEVGSWETLAPLSVPRCGCGSVVHNGNLYVVGGMHQEHVQIGHVREIRTRAIHAVERYNGTSKAWERVAPPSATYRQCTATMCEQKMYVSGELHGQLNQLLLMNNRLPAGIQPQDREDLIEVLDLQIDQDESQACNVQWTLGPTPPIPRRRNALLASMIIPSSR